MIRSILLWAAIPVALIDARVKEWQRKLESLFGRGRNGNGGTARMMAGESALLVASLRGK